jgi:hypothetical protein
MTLIGFNPDVLARGTKEKPVLIVVQNLNLAGGDSIRVGSDPMTLLTTGLIIAPQGASPQLVVTDLLWGVNVSILITDSSQVSVIKMGN